MKTFSSLFGIIQKEPIKDSPKDGAQKDVVTKGKSSSRRTDAIKENTKDVSDFNFSESSLDTKSREFFRTQDLSRHKFSITILSEMNWWPDEMILMVEILFLSYNEFINTYRSNSAMFDLAIRNAIYFMNQKKYSSASEINRFVVTGDYNIPDNYLSAVIAEDNCYMREIEDRKRSIHENKHYLLMKALEILLTLAPIEDGGLTLKKEYEDLIRMYVTIYNLKNMYAIVDDTLRCVISSALQNTHIGINLYTYFKDLLEDCDNRILIHLRKYYDEQLFTKVNIFRDLLLYAYHSTKQFNYVFNFARNAQHPEKLCPHPIIDNDTLKRIEYVYKFYLASVASRENKARIIRNSGNFEEMVSQINSTDGATQLITPRYTRSYDDLKGLEGHRESTFLISLPSVIPIGKNKRKERVRKASMDILSYKPPAVREDVAGKQ